MLRFFKNLNLNFKMSKFYAVAKGRNQGIFKTWPECQNSVKGFSGAVYKKFETKFEAEKFIENNSEPTRKKLKVELTEEEEIEDILKCVKDYDEDEDIPLRRKNGATTSKASHKSNKDLAFQEPKETTVKRYGPYDYEFNEDSDGYVHVYTDGSCGNNGKKNAIAGLGVYFGEDHPLNSSEPVTGRFTNNVGEIQAAIKAIKDAQESKVPKLNIFTDSKFLIESICKWIVSWKRNNWKLSSGKPVINKVDFETLDKLINSGKMVIKWSYIPAHKGHHGNEMADQLAKEGARKQR